MKLICLSLLLFLPLSHLFAGDKAPLVEDPHHFLWDPHRIDSHAPIGVMGEHTHHAGEWMLSYRTMFMNMAGMRDGSNRVTAEEVFAQGYLVSPTDMQMEMHMVGLMFAPSDWLTLMLMSNYVEKKMDHVTRPGFPPNRMRGSFFTTESQAWGDTSLTGLIKVYDQNRSRAHLHLGFSAPTGSIDETDDFNNALLPYSMQTGSGTWDLILGATLLRQFESWSAGLQGLGTIRLGESDADYSFGDQFDASAWIAVPIGQNLSLSLRLAYLHLGEIDGADPRLAGPRSLGMNGVGLVPTVNADNYGIDRLDLSAGVNWRLSRGPLSGHRFAVEVGTPIFQDHSGPFLETDFELTAGWQKSF